MAELVDALDSNSSSSECGFESHFRYKKSLCLCEIEAFLFLKTTLINKKTSHKCEVYIYRIQVIPEWIFYAACSLLTKTNDEFLKDLGPSSCM